MHRVPAPPRVQKAKEMAKENAEGNEAQLQEIERAFRFFVDASQQRLEEQVRGAPYSPDVAFQYANFLQTVGENASAQASRPRGRGAANRSRKLLPPAARRHALRARRTGTFARWSWTPSISIA